jgi:hypothetical protein
MYINPCFFQAQMSEYTYWFNFLKYDSVVGIPELVRTFFGLKYARLWFISQFVYGSKKQQSFYARVCR